MTSGQRKGWTAQATIRFPAIAVTAHVFKIPVRLDLIWQKSKAKFYKQIYFAIFLRRLRKKEADGRLQTVKLGTFNGVEEIVDSKWIRANLVFDVSVINNDSTITLLDDDF